MNRLHTFMWALMILGAITACEWGQVSVEDFPEPPVEELALMGPYLQKLAPKAETFSLAVEQGATITARQGTQLYIPPQAFINSSGQAVTGQVQVEITEIFSKKDMILANKPTVTATHMLVSAGELLVSIQQGNEELTLAPGVSLSVMTPAINPVGDYAYDMQLYRAADNPSATVAADSFAWALLANAPVIPDTTTNDTTSTVAIQNYIYELWQPGWYNVDAPYIPAGPNTTLFVHVQNNPNLAWGQTAVYVVPKEAFGVMQIYSQASAPSEVETVYQTKDDWVPIGMEATVLAISINEDEELSFAQQNIIISENLVVELPMQAGTEAELLSILEGL